MRAPPRPEPGQLQPFRASQRIGVCKSLGMGKRTHLPEKVSTVFLTVVGSRCRGARIAGLAFGIPRGAGRHHITPHTNPPSHPPHHNPHITELPPHNPPPSPPPTPFCQHAPFIRGPAGDSAGVKLFRGVAGTWQPGFCGKAVAWRRVGVAWRLDPEPGDLPAGLGKTSGEN